jgi:hypothetical protein
VNVSVTHGAIVSNIKSKVLLVVLITIDPELISEPDIKSKLPDK